MVRRDSRFGSLMFTLLLALGAWAPAGCGDEVEAAKDVADSCGEQACPVGTSFREVRSISAGTDITAGVDASNYEGDGAYKRFGMGMCEYACQVINACPEDTFPVITADCFTCGTLDAEGNVRQGSCGE